MSTMSIVADNVNEEQGRTVEQLIERTRQIITRGACNLAERDLALSQFERDLAMVADLGGEALICRAYTRIFAGAH